MTELNLKKGQHWYVKFPDNFVLNECDIIEITDKTVLLRKVAISTLCNSVSRYKISDVEFVEQVIIDTDNIYALWPDGTMCQKSEIIEFTHMSDDYSYVIVSRFDEDGSPLEWKLI